MTCHTPIVVALDFPGSEAALALAERLDPTDCRLKVGKELFTRSGPAIVESLQGRGFEVFLDLKFHDIPNTVAGACRDRQISQAPAAATASRSPGTPGPRSRRRRPTVSSIPSSPVA